MQSGGVRVNGTANQGYLQTLYQARIEYSNPFLSEGATVEIEIAPVKYVLPNNEAETTYLRAVMKPGQDGTWTYSLEGLRHGRGASWKIEGVEFKFYVTPAHRPTVTVDCDLEGMEERGVYSASFAKLSKLPGGNSSETVELEDTDFECDIPAATRDQN